MPTPPPFLSFLFLVRKVYPTARLVPKLSCSHVSEIKHRSIKLLDSSAWRECTAPGFAINLAFKTKHLGITLQCVGSEGKNNIIFSYKYNDNAPPKSFERHQFIVLSTTFHPFHFKYISDIFLPFSPSNVVKQ